MLNKQSNKQREYTEAYYCRPLIIHPVTSLTLNRHVGRKTNKQTNKETTQRLHSIFRGNGNIFIIIHHMNMVRTGSSASNPNKSKKKYWSKFGKD